MVGLEAKKHETAFFLVRWLWLPPSKIVLSLFLSKSTLCFANSFHFVNYGAVTFLSFRVGKPMRCMLDRDEDMMSTGTRHPFLANYKVIFKTKCN